MRQLLWIIITAIVSPFAWYLVTDVFTNKESLKADVYLAPFAFPLESLSEASVDDFNKFLKKNDVSQNNNETINPDEKKEKTNTPSAEMLNQLNDYLTDLEKRNRKDFRRARHLAGLTIIKIINDRELPVKDIHIYVEGAKFIGMAGKGDYDFNRLISSIEKKEEFNLSQIAQGDSETIYAWTSGDYSDMSPRFFEGRIKVRHAKGVGDISVHHRVGPAYEFLDRNFGYLLAWLPLMFYIIFIFGQHLWKNEKKDDNGKDENEEEVKN